jgi:hypothetical protein
MRLELVIMFVEKKEKVGTLGNPDAEDGPMNR